MISNKDNAIKKISEKFIKLSDLVLAQLDLLMMVMKSDATERITEEMLDTLTKNEKKIDNGEVVLDDLIVRAIVLHQPMASDLRQLFAFYRMVLNLERIGDLAIKISKLVNKIQHTEVMSNSASSLSRMLKLATDMVKNSLVSFINKDIELAKLTIKKDDEIDKMNRKLLKKSIQKGDFLNDEKSVILLSEIRSIISSIERIGDHATNIAEASIYSLSGSNIMHQDHLNSDEF